MSVDIIFVNPGNATGAYQELSVDYSAIEPPTWALLLAESVRSVGFLPRILDVNAERLSTQEAITVLKQVNARLICMVVYLFVCQVVCLLTVSCLCHCSSCLCQWRLVVIVWLVVRSYSYCHRSLSFVYIR